MARALMNELDTLRKAVEPRLCRTCKHWGNQAGLYVSECARITDQMKDDPKDPRYAALSTDDYATLETGPEFGCGLWEAKA